MAMKDFFISYARADRRWAEWIAWQLEDAGYSVVLQAWDFRPGSNFALEMHMAAQEAERTIAVLSPDYLKSDFTLSEWAAAFSTDPAARQKRLLPIRVRDCDPTGILSSIVYLDLVDLPAEEAKETLLSGIRRGRSKPVIAPEFPAAVPPELEQLGKSREDLKTIRVLHLADLHLGHVGNEVSQRSAYARLAETVVRDGKIDLVFVTGDLTSRGSLEGFHVAQHSLLELLERLAIPPDVSCFVVPGNHDVEWTEVGPADELILGNLDSQESIARVLSHAPTMSLLGVRLASFYEFTRVMFGASRAWRLERPWRVDKVDVSGTQAAVIQLNSVWTLGPRSPTAPILGEYQVRDALSEAGDCPVRLWLMHHPLSAIGDREEVLTALLGSTEGVDLVFSGMAHGKTEVAMQVQGHAVLQFSAGQVAPQCFWGSIIELDLGSAAVTCSSLRFEPAVGGWVSVSAQDGGELRLAVPAAAEPGLITGPPPTKKQAKKEHEDATVVESIRSRKIEGLIPIMAVSEDQFRRDLSPRPTLLITATEVELWAVLSYMTPKKGKRAIRRGHIGKETYYLGRYGVEDVILTMCGMGSMGRDSVILATQEAIAQFSPKAIFLVGIAFGRGTSKQALGDVLVASQIISYEQQRVGEKQVVHRGVVVETGPTLLNRIRQALDWVFVGQDGRRSRMLIGPVLSGEKLVDRASYKEGLFDSFPQAIGGEMEGAGLYAAAARSGLEWIVVKGICDWADGSKTDDAQPLAAAAAASLVHHVLSNRFVLESL